MLRNVNSSISKTIIITLNIQRTVLIFSRLAMKKIKR